jgi:GT2 family glycosyltransferase
MTDYLSAEDGQELRVSIIVVNYNGEAVLPDSLTALCNDSNSPVKEMIIVDNASTDQSLAIADHFQAMHPLIRVVRSDKNRGYGGGINLGVKYSTAEFLAILNMDAIVKPGWLTAILQFMDGHPEVGAVNPLLLLEGDSERINAIGQRIHVTALGFNQGLGQLRTQISDQPVLISGIQGGAFVIRKSIFEAAGRMDETGFLYHEDVDFSWLLQLMGYDLYCVPRSVVLHKYFLTMYPEKLFLLERNRLMMLLAYLNPSSLLLIAPLLLFTELMMWGYCLLRGWKFLRAKASSYRWVIAQRNILRTRRNFVRSVRVRSDWQVLTRLSWQYAWGQFITLGRERGQSSRQPKGGIPVNL